MTATEKEPYEEKTKEPKEKYKTQMEEYKDKGYYTLDDGTDSRQFVKRDRKGDKAAPKRPSSGLFLFTNAMRAQIVKDNPDAKFTQIPGIASAMWKKLSESEQAKYEKIR